MKDQGSLQGEDKGQSNFQLRGTITLNFQRLAHRDTLQVLILWVDSHLPVCMFIVTVV